jgi:hypothetical protein
MDSSQDRIEDEITTSQAKTGAKIESLTLWMDVSQECLIANLEMIKAKVEEACL